MSRSPSAPAHRPRRAARCSLCWNSRCRYVEDEAYTRRYPGRSGARIEVRLTDGTSITDHLDDATPLSDTEIAGEFRTALAARFAPAAAADLFATVTRLRDVPSVAGLVARFRDAAVARRTR